MPTVTFTFIFGKFVHDMRRNVQAFLSKIFLMESDKPSFSERMHVSDSSLERRVH